MAGRPATGVLSSNARGQSGDDSSRASDDYSSQSTTPAVRSFQRQASEQSSTDSMQISPAASSGDYDMRAQQSVEDDDDGWEDSLTSMSTLLQLPNSLLQEHEEWHKIALRAQALKMTAAEPEQPESRVSEQEEWRKTALREQALRMTAAEPEPLNSGMSEQEELRKTALRAQALRMTAVAEPEQPESGVSEQEEWRKDALRAQARRVTAAMEPEPLASGASEQEEWRKIALRAQALQMTAAELEPLESAVSEREGPVVVHPQWYI